MTCVFVYADRTVGFKEIPPSLANSPCIKFPKPRRLNAFVEPDLSTVSDTFDVDTFTYRGTNFQKLPIFCAEGLTVQEAYMTALSTTLDAANTVEFLRRNVRKFVKKRDPKAVELGEEYGEAPWSVDDNSDACEAQRIVKGIIYMTPSPVKEKVND